MTESEWPTCRDSIAMLRELKPSLGRKQELFVAACCRRHWRELTDEIRRHVRLYERCAEGQLDTEVLYDEWLAFESECAGLYEASTGSRQGQWMALTEIASAAWNHDFESYEPEFPSEVRAGRQKERGQHAELVRDIFGNPFRPVAVDPAWLTWNNATVPAMAQHVYENRAFHDLPILADALEDAGCADADLLGHCRSPGPHVRGCWAVDLLLGNS
jgi:hypothetical protein